MCALALFKTLERMNAKGYLSDFTLPDFIQQWVIRKISFDIGEVIDATKVRELAAAPEAE